MLPEWWLSNSGQVAQWEPEYSMDEENIVKGKVYTMEEVQEQLDRIR